MTVVAEEPVTEKKTAEPRLVRKTIEVYVCPSEDCQNYFGTNSMPKLEDEWTSVKTENVAKLKDDTGSRYTHNRAECPDCRQRGKKVQRQRRKVTITLPAISAPSPLPPDYVAPAAE